jgi:tetratricopeptide (TPR) repeat protein
LLEVKVLVLQQDFFLEVYQKNLQIIQRYGESEDLLNETITIYRAAGQNHALGRALIRKGMVHGYVGDRDAEVGLVREGLELIDVESEPQLVIAAWQNLILALHRRGENREALTLLTRTRPLYLAEAQRTTRIRFQWLEGNVAHALGRHEQAEGCLNEVRRRFIEEGIATDAALATLDLAGVLVAQGRYAEVQELAAETLVVFRAHGMATSAIASFVLLQRAAEKEAITAALLGQIGESLRKSLDAG